MTDETTNPPEPTQAEADAEAYAILREVITGWCLEAQLNGDQPFTVSAKLFWVLIEVLREAMGDGAIKTALLVCYDRMHDKPMDFIERKAMRDTVDNIVQARRKVEGGRALILPGELN